MRAHAHTHTRARSEQPEAFARALARIDAAEAAVSAASSQRSWLDSLRQLTTSDDVESDEQLLVRFVGRTNKSVTKKIRRKQTTATGVAMRVDCAARRGRAPAQRLHWRRVSLTQARARARGLSVVRAADGADAHAQRVEDV